MATRIGMTATTSTAATASADDERLTRVGIAHLLAGGLMVLVVILSGTREGDPLPFMTTAERIVSGLVPYRDVSSEYPPLALIHMTLPRILGGASRAAYQSWFSVISIALALGTLAVVYWLARRRWSVENRYDTVAMFVGLSLAALPVVIWRFDILPAFFAALALAAWAAGRSGWSGFSLGVGAMAKIYPVFLGPIFVMAAIAERRFRDAMVLVIGGAIAVALILAGPVLVAGPRAFSYVFYQENRGIEIESVAGGVAMLMHNLGNVPARVALGFGSWQISSPALLTIATPINLFNVLIVAGVVIACALAFIRDVRDLGKVQPRTLVTYLVATLLVLMLTNKVLSPQYVVWLLPFVATHAGNAVDVRAGHPGADDVHLSAEFRVAG